MLRFGFPCLLACVAACGLQNAVAATATLSFEDPQPKAYLLKARASEIDPKAADHPELNFSFTKKGVPADEQRAVVDTRVAPRGQLVLWLMSYSEPLFSRLASYGLHAIGVHYANGWFGQWGPKSPGEDGHLLGNIRLEAATGKDASPLVRIPPADSIAGRALSMVRHLHQSHPQGRWDWFLNDENDALRWDRVILAGASHGSTTAARMAKEIEVARVVMLCGPRDQLEQWQALPSKTPPQRYFGFSHVLDGGWKGDHYCRSWQMLGLGAFGPVTSVDGGRPPYGHSRRLISAADVGGHEGRAHSSVIPGSASPKLPDGSLAFEPVWKYLFTHPVEQVGKPVPPDSDCEVQTGR